MCGAQGFDSLEAPPGFVLPSLETLPQATADAAQIPREEGQGSSSDSLAGGSAAMLKQAQSAGQHALAGSNGTAMAGPAAAAASAVAVMLAAAAPRSQVFTQYFEHRQALKSAAILTSSTEAEQADGGPDVKQRYGYGLGLGFPKPKGTRVWGPGSSKGMRELSMRRRMQSDIGSVERCRVQGTVKG